MESERESRDPHFEDMRERYVAWLRMREALEEEDANVERERRVSYVRMSSHQQRVLAMCLDPVASTARNGAIPSMVEHESRSCWKWIGATTISMSFLGRERTRKRSRDSCA